MVGARVDWLEIAFRVDYAPDALSNLKRASARALKHQTAVPIALGRHELSLAQPGRAGKWCMRNASVSVVVVEKPPGAEDGAPGWGVRVEFHGTELLMLGHDAAVLLGWELARSFGRIIEARFGRTDLAADVAHYGLAKEDGGHFVKQRRVTTRNYAHDGVEERKTRVDVGPRGERVKRSTTRLRLDGRRVVAFLKSEDGSQVAEYYGGERFTGFGFGGRTSMSARLYDKRHELASNEDKRAAEEAWWTRGGWDGKAPVARVEFEFRGEALDELKMRHTVRGCLGAEHHAKMFRDAIDGAWAYATRKWLRLGRRGERDYVQPKWRAVQEVRFVAFSPPRERERRRGAAKAAQVEGSVLSLLGATHALTPGGWLARASRSTGEVDEWRSGADERTLVDEFLETQVTRDTQGACARQLAFEWRELGALAVERVITYERERAGGDAREALERLWAKRRETRGRFLTSTAPVPFRALAVA